MSEQLTEGTETETETDLVESDDVQADDAQADDAQSDDVQSGDVRSDVDGDGSAAAPRPSKVERLEQEGDIAADYLEELLDIADLDGDLDMDVEGDRASVQIDGSNLDLLVGAKGEVLEALQELTRLAVYRETGERSRLMLDVGGHRAAQRIRLVELAETSIAEVRASGEPLALDAMSAFERKVVHDAVAAAGLTSESEGAEPRRHVVILPA